MSNVTEPNEADPSDIYVESFLKPAVRELDAVFGRQYAMTHPSALGGYLVACPLDSIARALSQIATAIEKKETT